jgi:adenylate cyclase
MNIEIERKFLVDKDKWKQLSKPVGLPVRQGYLLTEPGKTIRVRIAGAKGYLTIKGGTAGIKRNEFEYEIPEKDAKELFESFSNAVVAKIRYKIIHHEWLWEVDEFLDDNEGLIIAEIELETEAEEFDLPEWISEEVTGDTRYYNTNLAVNPYKNK